MLLTNHLITFCIRDSFDITSNNTCLSVPLQFDENGSGKIGKDELRVIMSQIGHDLSDEELIAMIDALDEDKAGSIDYDNFLTLFKGMGIEKEDTKVDKYDGMNLQDTQHSNMSGLSNYQRPTLERAVGFQRDIDGCSVFDDAKQFISFTPIVRFVTWLYSNRKMLLLGCSHFVATIIIWCKSYILFDINAT